MSIMSKDYPLLLKSILDLSQSNAMFKCPGCGKELNLSELLKRGKIEVLKDIGIGFYELRHLTIFCGVVFNYNALDNSVIEIVRKY